MENSKEQILYNKFVDLLLEKLDTEISPKELEIVMKFLDNNNIQAEADKHKGLNDLTKAAMDLPFDEDMEQPLRRIK